VLIEHEKELRQVASPLTLPLHDADMVEPKTLLDMLERVRESPANLAESQLGRTDLERLQPQTLIAPQESPIDRSGKRWSRIRSLTGWAQVAMGGALAAADVGLGAAVVVTTGLPTLGVSTVPAAVGIAVSAHTGLNSAVKSLHDMAGEVRTTLGLRM